jgi:RHS repeat-associated protein
MDRLKTVTGPPPNWPYTAGPTSETYEYDRVLGASGITNLNGAPVPGRGLITKTTHADAKFQRFAYDAYGNKGWEDNEVRSATSYTYDNYNRLLTVIRPLNGITNYTYNPTNGGGSPLSHTTNNPDTVVVWTSDQTSIVTTNKYDENFRKTSSTTANATTWFHYDNVGHQDYVTDPRGSQSGDPEYTTFTDFDARNRKWRIREPLGRTTQFFYDDKLNVTRILRPDQTTETKAYDGMNRLKSDTVPKETGVNILTQFQYYPWNVHSAGLLQKVTDGEMHTTTFEYDPSGSKTKMTYQDSSYQTWAYDDAHNLKIRTTIGRETQNFSYDNRNRKVGEWWDGFPADAEWRVFGYDDANHLTLATNGLGNYWSNIIADVRRSYDAAGNLTQDQQKIYVNGVPVTKNVNYPTHDDAGKLLRMYVDGAAPAYDYTFSYDTMGRFEKIYVTNSIQMFQYYYDPASNEKQRNNLFTGVSQIYPRDSLNRLQYLDLQKPGATFAHEGYGYDAASRLGSVTREDNKQDQFTYYNDGELKVVTYGASPTATPRPSPTPPGPVAPPTFSPDGAFYVACANTYIFNVLISTTTTGARIRWTTDGTNWTDVDNNQIVNFSVAANQTKTLQAYAYVGGNSSAIHRADYSFERECAQQPLIGAPPVYPLDNTEASLMTPTLSTTTYTLDNAGNRRSVNGQSYSPNVINQYTSAAGYPVTNGSEHEISDYYGFHYVYMRDQELIKVTVPGLTYDLAYDALGRCVRRTFNNSITTYYIYDGDKPILEYNANNALVGFNLYGKGVDEIVERGAYGTDNQWHWYFLNQDHEGSVTHLTDADGNVIERYRYDVFGAPLFYNGSGTQIWASAYGNRFLFTGREYGGAWMYEYRARMYHSGLGRFMSEDPKLFDAGDYNLFRYCHNDPIDFTDPMGTQGEVTGLLQSGTHDRLWDMTKWFDSSNTIQGNFQVWTALQQQLGIRSGVTPDNYGAPATPFKMTSRNISVDYDGSPSAYGGPGHTGVETLANAAPGDNTIAYRNGKPVVENGNYVSKTSFHRGDQTIQRNNINGSIYPYAALGSRQTYGARLGDIVYARNHLNGKGVWMVYGDYRGRRNTGLEFSPAALNGLGIRFRGNDVQSAPVTLFVYPGSASGTFP